MTDRMNLTEQELELLDSEDIHKLLVVYRKMGWEKEAKQLNRYLSYKFDDIEIETAHSEKIQATLEECRRVPLLYEDAVRDLGMAAAGLAGTLVAHLQSSYATEHDKELVKLALSKMSHIYSTLE